MVSRNPLELMLVKTVAAPVAFATAGASPKSIKTKNDLPEHEVINFGSGFLFPSPHEQSSHDMLDKGQYVSETKEAARKKKSLKQRNDIKRKYRRLLQGIFRGETGNILHKKIEDADGIETLLYLRLRIGEKASHNNVSISWLLSSIDHVIYLDNF